MLKKIEMATNIIMVLGLMTIATVVMMTLTVGIVLGCMVWLLEFGFNRWIVVAVMFVMGMFMSYCTVQIDYDLFKMIRG